MLSARQAGRSIPATPSVGRERVRHKKTIETWAQWHDADDDVWRYGKSFETVPGSVLGKVYRMYITCHGMRELKRPDSQEGVSLAVLPCGNGRLVVSSARMPDGHVRHASIPFRLKRETDDTYERQKLLRIELWEFRQSCDLVGDHERADEQWRREESLSIVSDFAHEIWSTTDSDMVESDWFLKLYPAIAGQRFHFGAMAGEPEGQGYKDAHFSHPGDLVMTTPSNQVIGHYMLRPTGSAVIDDTLGHAVAAETVFWTDQLTPPAARRAGRDGLGGPSGGCAMLQTLGWQPDISSFL
jgi:hypothetical protein